MTLDTNSTAIGTIGLDRVFLYSGVSALHGCFVIPTIYPALVLLETCNVEQNFCSPLHFVKLELFWPSEMLLEIELHA
jgi:hypothetical protein